MIKEEKQLDQKISFKSKFYEEIMKNSKEAIIAKLNKKNKKENPKEKDIIHVDKLRLKALEILTINKIPCLNTSNPLEVIKALEIYYEKLLNNLKLIYQLDP